MEVAERERASWRLREDEQVLEGVTEADEMERTRRQRAWASPLGIRLVPTRQVGIEGFSARRTQSRVYFASFQKAN